MGGDGDEWVVVIGEYVVVVNIIICSDTTAVARNPRPRPGPERPGNTAAFFFWKAGRILRKAGMNEHQEPCHQMNEGRRYFKEGRKEG
jgi:hypothetical protein